MLVARKEYSFNLEPEQNPNKKKVTKTNKRKAVINKKMYLGIIFIIFVSSLFILSRYASITETRYEITKMQGQVRELELEKTDLVTSLEGMKNSAIISEKAQTSLGMVYPEPEQIVYISVNDVNEITQDDTSLAQRIREIFSIFSSIL